MKLRMARQARGYSLEDVQRDLNIRVRYLQAIEDEEFDELPGEVYARGFIRMYGEHVGLSGNQLVEEYDQLRKISEPQEEEPTVRATLASRSRNQSSEAQGKARRSIGGQFAVGAGIMVLLILGYVLFSQTLRGAPKKASSPPDSGTSSTQSTSKHPTLKPGAKPAQAPTKTPDAKDGTPAAPPAPATQVSLVQQSNNADNYSVSHADSLVVKMKPSGGACWVQVIADGKMIVASQTVADGQEVTWTAQHDLRLYTGRSSVLQLFVNDQNVKAEPVNGPYTYQFTRST